MFPNVMQIDVENDNVVSTLSDVVPVNVEISNFDVKKLVSTFHINLKTTLKRR